jgi:hypothetical protein
MMDMLDLLSMWLRPYLPPQSFIYMVAADLTESPALVNQSISTDRGTGWIFALLPHARSQHPRSAMLPAAGTRLEAFDTRPASQVWWYLRLKLTTRIGESTLNVHRTRN